MTSIPPRPQKRSRRLPRALVAALAVVGLVVAGAAAFALRPKAEKDPYRTAPLEQGSITNSVSASGALEALVTVDVGSQISGQIRQVMVDFNDEVRRGQVLAVLDAQTYQSRVAQGQADVAAGSAALRQAQAQAAAAKADYDRKRILVSQGIYAPTVLDQAQAAWRSAAAGVDAARARIGQSQASLRSQQVDLARTTIVSPIDGVVVDRQINPGQTVAASLQAPVLFRIAQDLSQVQVKISVDEADIGQLREGQRVRFTVDAFSEDTFEGRVTQVRKQPVTEQNVVAYVVIAEAANPDGKLLPGMTANADIIIDTRRNVLKAPAAALRWSPPGATVQVNTGGPPGMGGRLGTGPGGGGQGGGMGRRLISQLDLDAGQQKKWEAIQAEMRSGAMAAAASAGGDRQAMRQAMQKNMQAAVSKLEPSLKPDQKAKLAALRATLGQGRGRDASGMGSGVVWVLRDGKPQPIPVRVGASDGAFTQIVSRELKAGDQVITGGGPRPKAQARSPLSGGGGPGAGGPQRVRM